MTTETPAPLDVFRDHRATFLTSVVAGVSSLEEAVLNFELEHARRTAAAENEAADLRRENLRLLAELGEAVEARESAAPAAPAADMNAGELAEAHATITALREELDSRPVSVETPVDDDGSAEELVQLRSELALAQGTIASQKDKLLHEEGVRADIEAEALRERAVYEENLGELQAANRRLKDAVAEAAETLDARTAEAKTAARTEAMTVLAAVAADSPEVPLEDAVDLVTIAMDAPLQTKPEQREAPAAAEVLSDPVAQGPEPEAADGDAEDGAAPAPDETPAEPSFADIDPDFFATLAPPVVQGNGESIFGAAAEPAEDDTVRPAELEPQLVFDMDAALEEEAPAAAAPKPGFSMFRKGGQAAA